LSKQGKAFGGQAAFLEGCAPAGHPATVLCVSIGQADHAQAALPPARQVADVNDGVGPFHEQNQARFAIALPQVQVIIQVTHRLEQPDTALLFPTFVQVYLSQRLRFGFFQRVVERRARFKIFSHIGG
jgi:hypothetical protein